MSKKVKIFAIVALVLALIIGASTFLKPNDKPVVNNKANPLTSTTGVVPLPGAPNSSSSTADEFSKVLSSINSITIDTTIFKNRAYMLLRDYPVTLGTDVVGRADPFAPIGSDASSPVVQDVSVQTLQTGKITKTTAEAGAQVSVSGSTPTTIIFEYGTSDTFGSATAPINVTKNGAVLSTLTGLSPQTQYFVRAVAVRGSITTTANITSFVTSK
jgi:hypothetical protein